MAKNKTNVPKQPKVEAPKEEKPAKVEVIDVESAVNKIKNAAPKPGSGLDLNHQVDLMTGIKAYFHDDPEASKKYGDTFVDSMEKLNVTLIASIAIQEATLGDSAFALTVRRNQLPVIQSVCTEMGIVLDVKALPSPTEDGEEQVEVSFDGKKVKKEIKEQIKQEQKTAEDAETSLDPTKIKDDKQLSATLLSILKSGSRIFDNFVKAGNFYTSVMKLRASKGENSESELKRINDMTQSQVFEEVAKLIGPSPFVLTGIAKHLTGSIGVTGDPVSAFLTLKGASKDRKTDRYTASDETVAGMLKTFIQWSCRTSIADCEKNIAVLESDKEKNKGAIESNQTNIAYFNRIIDSVNNPSFDVAANLFTNYASTDKNSPEYKNSHRIFDAIINVYYPGTDVKKIQPESLKYNIIQRVGIILNLLVDVDSRNNNYSIANLTDLVSATESTEEKSAEEKPAEKEKGDSASKK